uniref:Uncharacterized protein n=1 Tax=Glossina austeni TaxID=7395 RepID=A0A1A9UVI9_GLOAU
MTVHCNHVDKPADVDDDDDDDDNNNVALLLLSSSLLFIINIKYRLVSTCQVRQVFTAIPFDDIDWDTFKYVTTSVRRTLCSDFQLKNDQEIKPAIRLVYHPFSIIYLCI